MSHEYSIVVDYQDLKSVSGARFQNDLRTLLTEFAEHLEEYLEYHGRGGWEPVSHSVAAIGDILVTSVLVRRQSS